MSSGAAKLNIPNRPQALFTVSLIVLGCFFFSTGKVTGLITLLGCIIAWNIVIDMFIVRPYSIAVAYLSFFTLNLVTILASSILAVKFTASTLLIVQIMAYWLVYAVLVKHSKVPLSRPNDDDSPLSSLVIIAIGMTVLTITLLPFLGGSAVDNIYNLSIGEDNISHYALHNSISNNESLTYFISDDSAGVTHNLKYYPQAAHANMSAMSLIVSHGSKLDQEFLTRSHIFQISANYAIFIAIVIVCLVAVMRSTLSDKQTALTLLALSPLLVYYVGFGSLFYLFTYGFHSQIVAYMIFFTIVMLLLIKIRDIRSALILLVIGNVALAHTWYFLSPVAALLTLLWALDSHRRAYIFRNRANLIIMLSGVGLAAIPVYVESHNALGDSALLFSGAVWRVAHIVIALCLIPVVSLLLLPGLYRRSNLPHKLPSQLTVMRNVAIITATYSILIGMYLYLKLRHLDYFYYKSVYTLIPISIILCGFILPQITTQVVKLCVNKRNAVIYCLLLFGILSFVTISSPSLYIHAYINRDITRHTFRAPVQSALEATKIQNGINDIVLYGYCDNVQAYITQRWVGAVLLSENNQRDKLNLNLIYSSKPSLDSIKDWSLSKKIELYYSDGCYYEQKLIDSLQFPVIKYNPSQ